MKAKKTNSLFGIAIVLLAILGGGGWIANIYKIFTTGFEVAQWGGVEVMRIIGVFIAPLGSVLGYF